MLQRQLDILKEKSAEIVIQYTNGLLDARLRGTIEYQDAYLHTMRLMYLWGVMKNSFLVGGVLYVGDTILSGTDLEGVYHKIWHYNGIYDGVDLSDYTAITPDDGDGGTDEGDGGGGGSSTDHYRSNDVVSIVGTNVVTFSSPLPSVDYTVTVYNTGASGYLQKNLVVSTKTANGFVCGDVLEAGILTYFAVIDL